MTLLRSNVEFAKRVFLDRLTANNAPSDNGPGDAYVYGGTYDPYNFGIGADCSGSAGIFIGAAINGPAAMTWGRMFSTETFPSPFQGFRRTTQTDLLTNPYPIKVCIMHGGGGPDSHMNCCIDGWVMESSGDHGTCTTQSGAISQSSAYWNDFWVYDGSITEDTDWRQPMGYPRGLDYAGARPSGAALKAAGISFVCRYLSDGGPSLPGKQLLPDEAADLSANGISIVSNWETTATRMLDGYQAGAADAQAALAQVLACGGTNTRPIYFSADFDATPEQQAPINDYLNGAASVLGVQNTGIYGGYWPLSRALDAGVCKWAWQTEAWSGSNVDSRVNIVQRNSLGYQYVGGVQCDIDEAHTDDFGQWTVASAQPSPPSTGGGVLMALTDQQQADLYNAIMGIAALVSDNNTQLRGPNQQGWPQLGQNSNGQNLTVVDGIAALRTDVDTLIEGTQQK